MEQKNESDKSITSPQQLKERLEEFKIIPDILTISPTERILIIFQSGVKVNLGNLITFYQYRKLPYLFYWPVDNFEALYSVLIIDIDFPSNKNPTDRSYVIFLVSNIHANDVMKGDIVAEYEPIEPTKDSGQHRILILGFKQPSFLKIETKMRERKSRLKFSLNGFIEKYKLEKPVIVNFFLCSG